MKSILISIQPKWCELIASGKKTIEVRKTRPKIETPLKCYIYCANHGVKYCHYWVDKKKMGRSLLWSGKVIGEFVCDSVTCIQVYYGNSGEKHLTNLFGIDFKNTCLSLHEIFDYIIGDKKDGTGWLYHITDLKIYDKPKELREFCTWRFGKNDGCETCFNKKWWEGDTADENIAKRICAPCQKDNFRKQITRPPQSWIYVKELDN